MFNIFSSVHIAKKRKNFGHKSNANKEIREENYKKYLLGVYVAESGKSKCNCIVSKDRPLLIPQNEFPSNKSGEFDRRDELSVPMGRSSVRNSVKYQLPIGKCYVWWCK